MHFVIRLKSARFRAPHYDFRTTSYNGRLPHENKSGNHFASTDCLLQSLNYAMTVQQRYHLGNE